MLGCDVGRPSNDVFTFAYQDISLQANNSRKTHILRLNDVLHASIERGDMARAQWAWSILARCKEYDWKQDWRTALLLLSTKPGTTHLDHERKLNFLRKTMRHHPTEVSFLYNMLWAQFIFETQAESILQEIVLCLIGMGRFEAALDELDLYAP